MIIPAAFNKHLFLFRLNQEIQSKRGGNVTGLISLICEKYYKLMEVLYIFPMIFKVKPIFNPI